jgi:hypothetical protein
LPLDESETMSDDRPTRTRERRDSRGEKGGALTLTLALLAWGVALIHVVNGFTRPIGLVEVRWVGDGVEPFADLLPLDGAIMYDLRGRAEAVTDVFLHRPLDKIDLIVFFVILGVALFLTHRLAREGRRGAKDVLEGTATARWLGIVLALVGVVPPLVQAQATRLRLADAGLADLLAPAHPAFGWGWVVAGLGVALVVPALYKTSRRGRD